MLKEERLADNYPILIAVNSRILDNELQRLATKIIKEEKTGLFSTHPSTRDRIEAAQGQNVPGVMHVDLPASLLFRNFLGLSREVSVQFYREVIGSEFNPHILKSSAAAIEQFQREDLSLKALTNFFQRTPSPGLLLRLGNINLSAKTPSEVTTILKEARNRQVNSAADAELAEKEYDTTSTKLSQAIFFRELVRIGVKPDFSGLDFRFRTLGEGNQKVDVFEANLVILRSRMDTWKAAAAERLFVALKLLSLPENQERIEGGSDLLQRMKTLLPILTSIGNLRTELIEVVQRLGFVSAGLGMLQQQKMQPEKAQALWESILSESDLFRRFLQQCRNTFGSVPYPFEHGKGVTLGEFLVPVFNQVESESLEYFHQVMQLLGYLHTTYRLALGEAAAVALAVEDALGMPRLPVSPPAEENEDTSLVAGPQTQTSPVDQVVSYWIAFACILAGLAVVGGIAWGISTKSSAPSAVNRGVNQALPAAEQPPPATLPNVTPQWQQPTNQDHERRIQESRERMEQMRRDSERRMQESRERMERMRQEGQPGR